MVVILARNATRPCFLTKIKRTPREDTGIRDVSFVKNAPEAWTAETSAWIAVGALNRVKWWTQLRWMAIQHFHKWRRICYPFVFMLMKPTGLTLIEIFLCILQQKGRRLVLFSVPAHKSKWKLPKKELKESITVVLYDVWSHVDPCEYLPKWPR